MSLWTKLRDTAESAAVLVGNYYLPGSSAITSKLTSEGSQKQLGSTVGQLAQLGSGGYGALEGNLANYSTAYDKVAGAFGGGSSAGMTGQQAVDAFNAGKISGAEFEALASGSGTTASSLLSGKGLSSYLTPAAMLGNSLIGANAANRAADVQADAARYSADLLNQQYQQTRQDQMPWMLAGQTALNKLIPLTDYKKFDMTQFQADPGYAFRLSEGQKQLDRMAAIRGGQISGGALKAAARYGQEMGSQEYQNAFNRYQTERAAQLNPLQSLAGVGQTTAQNLGSLGANYAANAGEAATGAANARASGYIGGANALTGGINQYLNYSNQQAQNSLLQQALMQRQATA